MKSLIVDNVRCFRDKQSIPIRPLTLLVGENSSGKSTFLAIAHYAQQVARIIGTPDFNESPFQLGAYDQIAHYHGGQAKRANHFAIGLTERFHEKVHAPLTKEFTLTATFESKKAQPVLTQWLVESGEVSIAFFTDPQLSKIRLSVQGRTYERSLQAPFLNRPYFPVSLLLSPSLFLGDEPTQEMPESDRNLIFPFLKALSQLVGIQSMVSAPIRTRPKRTYDLTKDMQDPEGEHIPMVLSQLQATEPEKWAELRQELEAFGKEAGLLSKIQVKRKGAKDSDPFQIEVAPGQWPFNLLDVGYGVSQVLPILVDALQAPKNSRFLLQQPEVHLHPKAQAQLGTFIGKQAKAGKHFVIETHSDYLLDRILMDVRDKTGVDASDVLILYFERRKAHVMVSPIDVTPGGELANAPVGYRDFFLGEQSRHLEG